MKITHLILLTLTTSCALQAKETTTEKAETTKNEIVDTAKKTGRQMKDEVCEVTNGKMVCFKRKMVNKAKNLGDKIGTKTTETINKVD